MIEHIWQAGTALLPKLLTVNCIFTCIVDKNVKLVLLLGKDLHHLADRLHARGVEDDVMYLVVPTGFSDECYKIKLRNESINVLWKMCSKDLQTVSSGCLSSGTASRQAM